MTGLWWSWKGDEHLLPWSVKAFRLVFPSVRVVVFDQGGATMSPDIIRKIAPDNYHVTEVARRRNLLGPTWIRYQFEVYARLAEFGHVIKTDPDYRHLSSKIFDGDFDMCGYGTHLPGIIGGHTYKLSPHGAKSSLEFAKQKGWEKGRIAEDYETSLAVATQGGTINTVPPTHCSDCYSKNGFRPALLPEWGILHSSKDKSEMAKLMEKHFNERFPSSI